MPKAAAPVPVAITAPDFQKMKLSIRGSTPLVINRFSQKAMLAMEETQRAGSVARSKKARDPKDFEALFEDAKHVSTKGWEGIHAAAFRNGAISACRACGFKMTHAKLAFMVIPDGFDRVDQAPLVRLTSGVAEQWIAPTRNQTGVMDLRSRPMYPPGWTADLLIRFDAGMLSASDVCNLIARVGLQVGVGEGRPDSKDSAGIGYGLFDLV